jgi:hypothetical protein
MERPTVKDVLSKNIYLKELANNKKANQRKA